MSAYRSKQTFRFHLPHAMNPFLLYLPHPSIRLASPDSASASGFFGSPEEKREIKNKYVPNEVIATEKH